MTRFQVSRRQWWTLAATGLFPVVGGSEIIGGKIVMFAIPNFVSKGDTLSLTAILTAAGIGLILYGFLLVSPSPASILAVLPVSLATLALAASVAFSERDTGAIVIAASTIVFLIQIAEVWFATRVAQTAT